MPQKENGKLLISVSGKQREETFTDKNDLIEILLGYLNDVFVTYTPVYES